MALPVVPVGLDCLIQDTRRPWSVAALLPAPLLAPPGCRYPRWICRFCRGGRGVVGGVEFPFWRRPCRWRPPCRAPPLWLRGSRHCRWSPAPAARFCLRSRRRCWLCAATSGCGARCTGPASGGGESKGWKNDSATVPKGLAFMGVSQLVVACDHASRDARPTYPRRGCSSVQARRPHENVYSVRNTTLRIRGAVDAAVTCWRGRLPPPKKGARSRHCAVSPPSTMNSAPVVNEDSSLARKRMVLATSSALPSAHRRGALEACAYTGRVLRPRDAFEHHRRFGERRVHRVHPNS